MAGEVIVTSLVLAGIALLFWCANDIADALDDRSDEDAHGDVPTLPTAFHSSTHNHEGQRNNG